MCAMHISIYMTVSGLTPSLDLCSAVCHWAKKWEGLIWGFAITVMCYKNRLLQTRVLSLELLNAKYHVSSVKHLFFLTYSIHFCLFWVLINHRTAEYASLFTVFLIAQLIAVISYNSSKVWCMLEKQEVCSFMWEAEPWHCITLKKVTQNTRCKALKKHVWQIEKINSSR